MRVRDNLGDVQDPAIQSSRCQYDLVKQYP